MLKADFFPLPRWARSLLGAYQQRSGGAEGPVHSAGGHAAALVAAAAAAAEASDASRRARPSSQSPDSSLRSVSYDPAVANRAVGWPAAVADDPAPLRPAAAAGKSAHWLAGGGHGGDGETQPLMLHHSGSGSYHFALGRDGGSAGPSLGCLVRSMQCPLNLVSLPDGVPRLSSCESERLTSRCDDGHGCCSSVTCSRPSGQSRPSLSAPSRVSRGPKPLSGGYVSSRPSASTISYAFHLCICYDDEKPSAASATFVLSLCCCCDGDVGSSVGDASAEFPS